jgi:hypothetical protein
VTYTDLLRLTVFLAGGEATVLVAGPRGDTTTLIVAAGWWLAAFAIGLLLGRPSRAADGVRDALANARTTPSLPDQTPGRIAAERLWPIGASALIAAGLGFFLPGVTAIGAGYALLVALAWRSRESAVLAVEERDGVKFYVEPGSAFEPIRLIRTPGLGRESAPVGNRRLLRSRSLALIITGDLVRSIPRPGAAPLAQL